MAPSDPDELQKLRVLLLLNYLEWLVFDKLNLHKRRFDPPHCESAAFSLSSAVEPWLDSPSAATVEAAGSSPSWSLWAMDDAGEYTLSETGQAAYLPGAAQANVNQKGDNRAAR